MKIELRLDENETSDDINTLSFTNAILNFIKTYNIHAGMTAEKNYCPFIFAKDIADIILVLNNSETEYIKGLKELQE